MNISSVKPSKVSHLAEFCELPRGGPCPVTGLRRSTIYNLEAEGAIRLVRIRRAGNIRGRVLVDVASVRAYFAKLARQEAGKRGGE